MQQLVTSNILLLFLLFLRCFVLFTTSFQREYLNSCVCVCCRVFGVCFQARSASIRQTGTLPPSASSSSTSTASSSSSPHLPASDPALARWHASFAFALAAQQADMAALLRCVVCDVAVSRYQFWILSVWLPACLCVCLSLSTFMLAYRLTSSELSRFPPRFVRSSIPFI